MAKKELERKAEHVVVLETERLRLRKLSEGDAAFILKLLNEPSFIQNIGDKGVRTLDDACSYILNGPVANYQKFGFGPYLVELGGANERGIPIGMCGLLKRETLEDVDVGYALAPQFWSRGYAREAVWGVLSFANKTLGLKRVVAITNPDNASSIRLLETIGFQFEKTVRVSEVAAKVQLFAFEF
ncbi:MAG TPA: GNAT family N-acetyltransferase [Pyrinomonadaceae bacterium]|nr:GNAT family N-acetyltransferase [Pyrinomonadaceae bacterium]